MPKNVYIRKLTADQRFEEKYERLTESGCWLWTGSTYFNGYGSFFFEGKSIRAHRYSYVRAKGKIPDGLQIDHLCRVRCCVNPDHLEAVTAKKNINRGRNYKSEKTHCPRGHPYSGANLLITKPGSRQCRACHRKKQRDRYWRNKNASGMVGDE